MCRCHHSGMGVLKGSVAPCTCCSCPTAAVLLLIRPPGLLDTSPPRLPVHIAAVVLHHSLHTLIAFAILHLNSTALVWTGGYVAALRGR